MAELISTVLPWLECFVGLALLLGLFLRGAYIIAVGLLSTFAFALSRKLLLGLGPVCGCLGIQPTNVASGWLHVALDLSLLAIAVLFVQSEPTRFSLDALFSRNYWFVQTYTDKLKRSLQRTFSLDLRSIALMRIGIGLTLLVDLITRMGDLKAHYTDQGLLPLSALFELSWNKSYLSLHTMSGLFEIQLLLFLIQIIFAVFLVLGYRTRFAAILSWMLLVSLHHRNPIILQGGDELLRMILFFGIFLPWGRAFSVDNALTDRIERGHDYAILSYATVAYLVQMILLYTFNGLFKNSPEWQTEGSAIYYTLSLDQLVRPLGQILYSYPDLMRVLTHYVYWLERLGPFLLIFPIGNPVARTIGVFLFVTMHIGIGLTIMVGIFPFVCISALLGLIPGQAWDMLSPNVSGLFTWISHLNSRVGYDIAGRLSMAAGHTMRLTAKSKGRVDGLRNGLILFVLVFIIAWNLDQWGRVGVVVPDEIRWAGPMFGFEQNWRMFAPEVFKDGGWYTMRATLSDGRQVDVFQNDGVLQESRPANIRFTFKSDRWRKYLENIYRVGYESHRKYFAAYLKNKWNENHSARDQVMNMEIIYNREISGPDYVRRPLEKLTLYSDSHENQVTSSVVASEDRQ
jgi:uncharacterized membrane protein YphA (DoxX/SURF4 family)